VQPGVERMQNAARCRNAEVRLQVHVMVPHERGATRSPGRRPKSWSSEAPCPAIQIAVGVSMD
jgi:hypothetical protein